MFIVVDKSKCVCCFECVKETDLNGLPCMAYEGIDLSTWPERDADILIRIIMAKQVCPSGAIEILTSVEFRKRKEREDVEN